MFVCVVYVRVCYVCRCVWFAMVGGVWEKTNSLSGCTPSLNLSRAMFSVDKMQHNSIQL